MILRFWQDQRGQDMTEFALLGAFVAAAAVALSPAILAVALYLGQSIRILDLALSSTAGR